MAVVRGNTTNPGEAAVAGESKSGPGVQATSQEFEAVHAETNSPGTAAVAAYNMNSSSTGAAVFADNRGGGPAVFASSGTGAAVEAKSQAFEAVHAETNSPGTAAIAAYNLNTGGTGAALFCETRGSGPAGFFKGNVVVTGDILLEGADYAEALTTTDQAVESGMVVVLGADGEVHPCDRDYDTAVAGIVSGARGVKPAIVLDRHENSAHIALMGKVWCFADADTAAIRPGDLLTTSITAGHCRRVTESDRAFGAVIGKALTPLPAGRGFVHVLVSPR